MALKNEKKFQIYNWKYFFGGDKMISGQKNGGVSRLNH